MDTSLHLVGHYIAALQDDARELQEMLWELELIQEKENEFFETLLDTPETDKKVLKETNNKPKWSKKIILDV